MVEDEGLIRLTLADMIEELGHRVVAEAGNLQEALVLAETAVFDLAILDINIGGSSIVPVAEIVDRRGLPFLFMSGYGSGGRPELFIERPALQKPLMLSKRGETIDAILAAGASSTADNASPNPRSAHEDS